MNYIVTGLLCSGKSTFLEAAKANDFQTLYSDKLVEKLYEDSSIINKLQKKFNNEDLSVNPKEHIKKLFFKSNTNKNIIESIIHPEVHNIIHKELEKNNNLIVEIPPLLNNYELLKDNNSVFIDADIENRKMRFLKRKNKAEVSTFEKINNMQSDYMKLKMTCDLIIYNNHKENFNKYFGIEIIKS